VKNSEKGTLLSFSATAVFQHDVMASENDVLQAGSEVGVFGWVILNSNCRFELQVEGIRASGKAVRDS